MFSNSNRRLLDCASAPSGLRIRSLVRGGKLSKGRQLPTARQWYGDAFDRLPADHTARSHPQIGFVKVALCMRGSQEMKA